MHLSCQGQIVDRSRGLLIRQRDPFWWLNQGEGDPIGTNLRRTWRLLYHRAESRADQVNAHPGLQGQTPSTLPLLLLMNCPCRSWLDLSLHSWGRSYLAVKNSSSTSRLTLRRGREFIGFIGIPHWKLLERNQGRLSGRSPFMCLGHFFYLRDHRSWHWWHNLWILSSREIKIQYIRLSMWWEVMILLNKQTACFKELTLLKAFSKQTLEVCLHWLKPGYGL